MTDIFTKLENKIIESNKKTGGQCLAQMDACTLSSCSRNNLLWVAFLSVIYLFCSIFAMHSKWIQTEGGNFWIRLLRTLFAGLFGPVYVGRYLGSICN